MAPAPLPSRRRELRELVDKAGRYNSGLAYCAPYHHHYDFLAFDKYFVSPLAPAPAGLTA